MNDPQPTDTQAGDESATLRRRVAELKNQVARYEQVEADRRRIDDGLPVLLAAAGRDGYYKTVNAAFERILGWSEEESLSRPFLEFIHPEDRPAAIETFARLASGETVTDFVDRNVCKDGSHRWISWTVIPLPDRGLVYGIGTDITGKWRSEEERKRAEEQLQLAHAELEQRVRERTAEWEKSNAELAVFRRFAEASGQGFGMADLDGYITYVNPAACRLAGLERPEDAIGKHLTTYYPDGYALRREQEIVPALLQKGHWEGEVDVQRDGKPLYVLQNSFLVRDESGNPSRLASVITDITERRQAQEALRQSHDELQTIYDGIIEGILITAVDTKRFVRANASMCRMLGYTMDELLRLSVEDIHPPTEVPDDLRRFSAAAEGRVTINEERPVLRKDGSVFYADISGHPLIYDKRPCLLALFRDVTERRNWAAALRRSEERYRTVVEDQTEIISRFRADGTFTFVNDVYCRFFGKTSVELLGNKWQPVVLPEDLPMVEQQVRTLAPESPTVVVENRVLSGRGEVRWMQFVNRGFFDAAGQLTEIQSVGRDVTERKRAQQALEREQATLLHMLRASDHERQTISYDIHDGLAQQLAAATMHFQTYEHLMTISPGKARTAYDLGIAMVQQAHFEARRLISGVRPPALDEAGIAVAIAHLVHEQREAKGPKVEYYNDVQFDRLPPILENAIYRIAQEALANACEHSGSERVRVSLVQDGDQVCLEVQDWGRGFDPTSVEDDRFGIAGIKQRARLLGGELSLVSEPGKGTYVRAVLPVILRK